MPKLSKSEIETYQNKGYVIPDYKVPENVLRSLKEALEETLNINANIRPEQLASIHTEKSSADDTVGHSTFLKTALNSELVDLVSSVLGDNIIMWGVQVFCKPGVDGMEVPMHQDGQYWPIRPLATCTVWLAIDDATEENGCLKFIKGSHRDKKLKKHEFNKTENLTLHQELLKTEYNEDDSVNLILNRGQISLHDVYLVHGSEANFSPKSRRGMTMRFMPTTSVFDHKLAREKYNNLNASKYSDRKIYHARGIDISKKNILHYTNM